MPIITLTTDFGLKDHYVSSVKGAILSQLPEAKIVDISNVIEKYHLPDTAFILKNAFVNFPKGSIHIIGVKGNYTKETPHLIVLAQGHYFIGADSGIFSLLFGYDIEKIIALPENNSVFPSRDIFATAACQLAKGVAIEELGTKRESVTQMLAFNAAPMGDIIRGIVTYVDVYGNSVTNITKALFEQTAKGRGFEIELRNHKIDKLSTGYSNVPQGEILALFNSSGYLEIAINQGNADSLLALKVNATIVIQFI